VSTTLARWGSAPQAQRSAPRSAGDNNRTHLGRRDVVPAPVPPVEGGPRLLAPARHGGFVARPGAAHRLLGTPAQRCEEPAHRGGVVQDATRHPSHRGHARAGPHLAAEAIGCRATMPQRGHTGQRLGGQPTGCSRGGLMPSGRGTAVPSPLQPWADGGRADAPGRGHLPWGPAVLLEGPGLHPSRVLPGVRCWIPTGQVTTRACRA
jgi:hypothetical protein